MNPESADEQLALMNNSVDSIRLTPGTLFSIDLQKR